MGKLSCKACRLSKVKCEVPIPGKPCRRCDRLGLECIDDDRAKGRPRNQRDISRLGFKVRALLKSESEGEATGEARSEASCSSHPSPHPSPHSSPHLSHPSLALSTSSDRRSAPAVPSPLASTSLRASPKYTRHEVSMLVADAISSNQLGTRAHTRRPSQSTALGHACHPSSRSVLGARSQERSPTHCRSPRRWGTRAPTST